MKISIKYCHSLLRLRSALVADLCIRPLEVTLWFRMLALPLDSVGLSRLWVLLFGIASPLTCVLFRETSLALFINYLRLSFLTGPGSGAPLSSYLEGALYKFHR